MSVSIGATFKSCNFCLYIFLKVATKYALDPYERIGAKLQNIKIANVAGKKDDPSYAPVRGHVPVDLYKKFKIFCLDRGVDNSEGLELLLSEYFEDKEQSAALAVPEPPVPQPQQQVIAQPPLIEPATEQPVVRSRRPRQPRREPKNS